MEKTTETILLVYTKGIKSIAAYPGHCHLHADGGGEEVFAEGKDGGCGESVRAGKVNETQQHSHPSLLYLFPGVEDAVLS